MKNVNPVLLLVGCIILCFLIYTTLTHTSGCMSPDISRDTVWYADSATIKLQAMQIQSLTARLATQRRSVIELQGVLAGTVAFYESTLVNLRSGGDSLTIPVASSDTVHAVTGDTVRASYHFPPLNYFDLYIGYVPKVVPFERPEIHTTVTYSAIDWPLTVAVGTLLGVGIFLLAK